MLLLFVVVHCSDSWVVTLCNCVLWTAAHQASLSFTISQSLLKLISIESMILSNHLILGCPLLLLSSIFPSIRVFFSDPLWRGWTHVSCISCVGRWVSLPQPTPVLIRERRGGEARCSSQETIVPGGPVVRTSTSNAGSSGLIPGWGPKIPHSWR